MKRILKTYCSLIVFSLLVSACQPKPKPIEYGHEACSYCSMTIIDKQHASQLVTEKGKVYSFDAIECMVRSDHLKDPSELAYLLCNDYMQPGIMIDAREATYLISERIPSPMGAYLSGFSSMEAARKIDAESSAEYLNWEELNARFSKE